MTSSTIILCAAVTSMLAMGASADTSILSQSKVKTIYIMQFSHLDIGYTNTQAQVSKRAVETLDRALEFCRKEPDYKWTVESLWQLEQWMNNRTPAQIDELMAYVKSGRIGLTACYAGLHSAPMGYEEFCRHMYFMDHLRVRYGVKIDTAIQNDIAGYSWAYPQVFKRSGVKYFATGINTFIGAGADIPVKDRPFYWEGPDGSRTLTYIAHDPFIGGSGYLNALLYYGWGLSDGKAEQTVPTLLQNLEKSGYPYDAILVMSGGKGDNQNTTMELLDAIRDWNAKHETPKMVLSTPNEFFDHITGKYGDQFPVYRGDWAGLWDQVKESLPYGSGLARIAHDSLPVAEALVSVNDSLGLQAYPRPEIEGAWRNLITWEEHSGGGSEPKFMARDEAREDSAVKLRYAVDAYDTAKKLTSDAISALKSGVRSGGRSILVWNPLPGKRSGIARAELSGAMDGFELVDAKSGDMIPWQKGESTGEILFRASDVPGMGYRTFDIRKSSGAIDAPSGVTAAGNRLENDLVRVDVDSNGMISSIYDKKLHREFVQSGSKFGFGQLIQADDKQIGNGECDVLAFAKPRISVGMRGPCAGSLIITGSGSPLVRTEVTLYDGSRAVYVRHTIDKSRMPKANMKYDIAYPLSIPNGRLLFDTPAGLLNPKSDLMPKTFPIVQTNHGGVISGKDCGMTIFTRQAFNWEFGKMNSWWGGMMPPDSTILLTRLMNNVDFYEFKEGPGEYMQEEGSPSERVYGCAFLPHEGSSRFGLGKSVDFLLSESAPFIAAEMGANPHGSLPSGMGQMLRIEGKGIALLVFKKAEDGDGYILRLMETAGIAKSMKIGSGILKLKSAEMLDMVEHKTVDLTVKNGRLLVSLTPREILTIRLRFGQ